MIINLFRRTGWLALLIIPFSMRAQIPDWEEFRRQVLENHPVALQSDLYRNQADQTLLRAKGGFDPKLYSEFYTKNFGGKTYFRYSETGVKLPTWAGLEVKAAYNTASGNYLNSESTLPSNGQASLGFNWSLGQGLLVDERRTALQQARIGRQAAEAERDLVRNDLLLDAAKTYWNWVVADNQLRIFESALQQARIRHEGLCESYRQGEKPAVDTIETFIQVQNRLLDINFATVDLQNASLALRNFLWEKDGSPATTLPTPVVLENIPVSLSAIDREALRGRIDRHPELRVYQAKLQTLGAERRLKNEKRKPVLDVNYNLLGAGWEFFPSASADGPGIFAQDIKWGVSFSYPILNRKARGDWQITQVKIAQTELDIRQKRQVLETKVAQYANELENLRGQIALYSNITDNYRRLLDAETEKFGQGESSVFLINAREQRWLEARIKYLKLLSEFRKTEAALQWAAGG
jgi:outer membrane protein TolC